MNIVADPNIPLVREAFAEFGEVVLVPGRELNRGHLDRAGALLVRSVTKVDGTLLEGTPVSFVGTATSGIDHIDRGYLERHGIAFASAPGSNAEAVAEYVLSALLVVSAQRSEPLAGKTAGIVGCGEVGSRLLHKLQALGVKCLVNDPPLVEQGRGAGFADLRDLAGADILSLHVPLTTGGRWPTAGLIDAAFLERLRPDAVVINAARGGVLDEGALLGLLRTRPAMAAVIDCWAHEPAIDAELLGAVAIGTPHIAGYSQDGKLKATQTLYDALCGHLGRMPCWRVPWSELPAPQPRCFEDASARPEEVLRAAVLACYDVRRDARALSRAAAEAPASLGTRFDALRRDYPLRREFGALQVTVPRECNALGATLERIGFRVSAAGRESARQRPVPS